MVPAVKRGLLTLCAVASVALVAGCGGGGGPDAGPSATLATATTQRTTTTRSPKAEVEAAYLKSWDVYTKAMRTFDTSHLADVYADKALQLRLDEINGLKAKHTPARMRVDHNY